MTSSWIYLIAASVLLLIGIGLLLSLRRERDELAALADFQGQKLAGEWQQGVALADQAAEKLPLGKLRWHFRWAQMNGAYKGQTIGRILMIVLLYGTFGALLPLWNPAPVSFLVPVLAAGMPLATLQRKGQQARQRAERAMPEVAVLVAAELAAGNAPEAALGRAAKLPGPLSVLIQAAIDATQESGMPLFSRGSTPGALKQVFDGADLPALRAFASQLDLVAERGVEGAELMSEIASSLAREYREQILEATEKLDGRLTMAVAVFYFMPMFLLIVGSFFAAVLTSI